MQKRILLILLLIVAVSFFIRAYGLSNQGLLFIDEGTFVYRAKTFQLLASQDSELQQPFNYADKKILWLLSLMGVLNFTDGSPIAAQWLSLVCALLTIVFTFLLARTIYNSDTIGLFSAGALGLSVIHVFYSRIAMPEMMNMVWVILMVWFYYKAKMDNKIGLNFCLSGLMMGLCLLTDVFRAGLIPLCLVLIECGVGCPKKFRENINLIRLLSFFLIALISSVVLIMVIWPVLKMQGIWLTPYLDIIQSYVNQHTQASSTNWTAVKYAFGYISFAEGWQYLILAVLGLFFVRSTKSTLMPFLIVLIYILSWVFVDERAIRALTPVLPFIAIYIGLTFYHLYNIFQSKERALFFVVLALFVGVQVSSIKKVYSYHSDLQPAMEYIKGKDPKARILMDSQSIAVAFDFDFYRYGQLTHQTEEDVRALTKVGFHYLITDFVKFAVNSVAVDGRVALNPFVTKVEKNCNPIKEYPHFNESLERWMLMEVNQYTDDVRWLDEHISDRTGRLRIYDLDRCLIKLTEASR